MLQFAVEMAEEGDRLAEQGRGDRRHAGREPTSRRARSKGRRDSGKGRPARQGDGPFENDKGIKARLEEYKKAVKPVKWQNEPPRAHRRTRRGAVRVEDPGDDRLSRQGHYHGPGGLNGRVRDGNGCGPAGMVAGKAAGGRCRPRRPRWIRSAVRERIAGVGSAAGDRDASATGRRAPTRRGSSCVGVRSGRGSGRGRRVASRAAGRGGQAARLLGPVGCGGRPPCTPGLSTWSSSRSLRS